MLISTMTKNTCGHVAPSRVYVDAAGFQGTAVSSDGRQVTARNAVLRRQPAFYATTSVVDIPPGSTLQ